MYYSTSQKSIWDHSFSKIRCLVFIRLAWKVVWKQLMEEPRARSLRPNTKQDAQGLLAADCKNVQRGGKENKEHLKGSRGTEEFFHTAILAQAVCNEQFPAAVLL